MHGLPKLHRAKEKGTKGNIKACVRTLLQDGTAEWTQDSVTAMLALHPQAARAPPPCPDSAPRIIVESDKVVELVRRLARGTAAGPSGWTAELLLPLLADNVCLQAVTLLVQLIANNELDPHSRVLLSCSTLHAIPKSDGGLRPLALGDLFVKIANKLCFAMDETHFPAIFEPLQLAVCCPGGSERAIQTMQAALEANAGNIAIHVDSVNAYNSADRAMMLESVYSDHRLAHLWRAFAFCYGQPSLLLLRGQDGALTDIITSEQGGWQGCVLAGLDYAHLLQPAYSECVRGKANTTARAVMDDLAICGPPAEAFAAYAKYAELAAVRRVAVNVAKSHVQQPLSIAAITSTLAAISAWMTSQAPFSSRPSWPNSAPSRAPSKTLHFLPILLCTWLKCMCCLGLCSSSVLCLCA